MPDSKQKYSIYGSNTYDLRQNCSMRSKGKTLMYGLLFLVNASVLI